MRIIILTAIPFWHPGTSELIQHLKNKGINVTALDIFHGKRYNDQGEIENLVPFKMTGVLARIYMKLFRNAFTKKHTKSADILDIHFVEPAYSNYIPKLGKKYICTLFGSDLFRTNDVAKQEQRVLFETCDRILLSQNMVPYFEEHFSDHSDKYQFNQYGSARIDSVFEGVSTINKSETQKKWSIPKGKIVITLGYNGKPEQQHIKALEQLEKLPEQISRALFLVLPMTYGGDASYWELVRAKAEELGIDYKIVRDRLTDSEITELRIISDISLNTQTTDALASSVKEAMVSGDILLVGDWLPYNIYKELGVFYLTTDFESLAVNFQNVLKDVDKLQKESVKNADIIRKFASWSVLIDRWIDDYQRLYNEGK